MPYRVLIYPSTKFGCGTTSAVPWISIAGQLGETGIMDIPKGCLEFSVEVRLRLESTIHCRVGMVSCVIELFKLWLRGMKNLSCDVLIERVRNTKFDKYICCS